MRSVSASIDPVCPNSRRQALLEVWDTDKRRGEEEQGACGCASDLLCGGPTLSLAVLVVLTSGSPGSIASGCARRSRREAAPTKRKRPSASVIAVRSPRSVVSVTTTPATTCAAASNAPVDQPGVARVGAAGRCQHNGESDGQRADRGGVT